MSGETLFSRAEFNLEMAQHVLKKLDDGDDRVLIVQVITCSNQQSYY